MVLDCQLPVGLLDFTGRGTLGDAQYLVEVTSVYTYTAVREG